VKHEVLSGILLMAGYVVVSTGTAAVQLWFQRRFFLHEDENQSFAVPGVTSAVVGILYLWLVMTSGV
jgi:hypothetical protein